MLELGGLEAVESKLTVVLLGGGGAGDGGSWELIDECDGAIGVEAARVGQGDE